MNHFLKMYKVAYSIILLIPIFVSSCDKEADTVELPEYKPLLVLHSYISPSDTILYAYISFTKNVYGVAQVTHNFLPVKVSLIDEDKLIPFTSIDTSGFYALKYQIFEGKTYGIIAKCEGYPDVFGSCKVPNKGSIDIEIDTSTVYDYRFGEVKKFDVTFVDIPNQTDFYKVQAFTRDHFSTDSINTSGLWRDLPVGEVGNYFNLVTDNLADGKIIHFSYSQSISFFIGISDAFTMEVLRTDKDYYLYHNSLQHYNDGENPFQEFSPVYTNLKGGFGIFCSYIKCEKTMLFPENVGPNEL